MKENMRLTMDYIRYGNDEAYTQGVGAAMLDYICYRRKSPCAVAMYRRILTRPEESLWDRAYAEGYLAYRMPVFEAVGMGAALGEGRVRRHI